jgi:hypothetical protein
LTVSLIQPKLRALAQEVRVFDDQNNLTFDKRRDIVFCPWVDPGEDLEVELRLVRFNNGGAEVTGPEPGALAAIGQGNLFIWGHGNYADSIGNEKGDKLSARGLAGALINAGLPQGYNGNIVVWSCWAGVPGGVAQTLMLCLRNKGYSGVRVWGCLEATGTLKYGMFQVKGGLTRQVAGDTTDLPFGTGSVLVGTAVDAWASRGHMRCYPPA